MNAVLKPSKHQEAMDALKRARLLWQALPGWSPHGFEVMTLLEDAEVAGSLWFYIPEMPEDE